MPDQLEYETFRGSLIDLFRRQVFGPAEGNEAELKETLTVSPLQLYATGVLFPQKLVHELLEGGSDESKASAENEIVDDALEPTPAVEIRGALSDRGDDPSSEREPINLANEFSPSAAGLSCRLGAACRLSITVKYGTYRAVKVIEAHPRAGAVGVDGTPFPTSREVPGYQRTHHEKTFEVAVPEASRSMDSLPIDNHGLKLHITVRRRRDDTIVVSVMVVNRLMSRGGASPAVEDCYFQTSLSVRESAGAPVFLPIDRETGGDALDDPELASMDLLYRHRRAFALGHGSAGDWNRDETLSEQGRTDCVQIAAVPTYDLKPIRPRETAFQQGLVLPLSMSALSGETGETDKQILDALTVLADDYAAWIAAQVAASENLDALLKATAEKNLTECRRCLDRMRQGIAVLASDAEALLAFRLMNRAMLVQQHHSRLPFRPLGSAASSDQYSSTRQWRPFQLAFILMNIASMSSPTSPERALVDLIWFPTGGGKTEAYLGLAAFTICLERLRGDGAGSCPWWWCSSLAVAEPLATRAHQQAP